MDVSKFLSKVIGIYLVIISLAMLIKMDEFINLTNNLVANAPLMFVTGFITLILGILMVVSHNIWQWNWRILITILSWVILLKGVCILFCPQYMERITHVFLHNTAIIYSAISIDLILGVFLIYLGFKHDRYY